MSEYKPDDLKQIKANMMADFQPRAKLQCSACGGDHVSQSEVKRCCILHGKPITVGVVERVVRPEPVEAVDPGHDYHVGQRFISPCRNIRIEITAINGDEFTFDRHYGDNSAVIGVKKCLDHIKSAKYELMEPGLCYDTAPTGVPQFPFSIIPGHYVAMDKSGQWYDYDVEPILNHDINDCEWLGRGSQMSVDGPEWDTREWENSLFKMTDEGLTRVADNG